MIYISGAISNPDEKIKKQNLERFNEVERELIAQGKEVFNPASFETEGYSPWEWYLARDLRWMEENRPVMYFLVGWEKSLGARLEMEYAKLLGLELTYETCHTSPTNAEERLLQSSSQTQQESSITVSPDSSSNT